MSTTTNVKQTKLNIMTQSQYNSATKNPTELYMITDAQISYNDLSNKPTIPTAVSQLTNDSGYITGINGTDVTTALGYTPYNSSNPNGYTSVIESTVSGWGFTKNVGTVTSVNSILPDNNGNVSIPISGAPTWGEITGNISDQTDLQSALDSKLQNKATGTDSLNIIGNVTNYARTISIGKSSYVPVNDAIAVGYNTQAKSQYSMAIGGDGTIVGTGSSYSIALGIGAGVDNNKTRAIQIGEGTNSTQNTLQIGFGTNYNYTLLDGTTGLIPDARISTNIARTSALSNMQTTTNLVTSVSSSSTDSQYPSAKLFYDTVGDIESALDMIISGSAGNINLTVSLTGSGFNDGTDTFSFTIGNNTYGFSDFTNNSMTIQVPGDASWSATYSGFYILEVGTSNGANNNTAITGNLNLSTDGTLTFELTRRHDVPM